MNEVKDVKEYYDYNGELIFLSQHDLREFLKATKDDIDFRLPFVTSEVHKRCDSNTKAEYDKGVDCLLELRQGVHVDDPADLITGMVGVLEALCQRMTAEIYDKSYDHMFTIRDAYGREYLSLSSEELWQDARKINDGVWMLQHVQYIMKVMRILADALC